MGSASRSGRQGEGPRVKVGELSQRGAAAARTRPLVSPCALQWALRGWRGPPGRPGASACLRVRSRVWMALQVWATCPSVCLLLRRPPCRLQDPSSELGRAPGLWGFPRVAAGLGQQGHWETFVCSCGPPGVPQAARSLGSGVPGSRRVGSSAVPAAGVCHVRRRCRRGRRRGRRKSGECAGAPPPWLRGAGGRALLPGLSGGR